MDVAVDDVEQSGDDSSHNTFKRTNVKRQWILHAKWFSKIESLSIEDRTSGVYRKRDVIEGEGNNQ